MNYRKLSKTGVEVSALGFGCMRFPTTDNMPNSGKIDEAQAQQMLRHAIDSGVNYIDTARHYHNGNSEPVVGRALQDGYRERVYLATKAPVYSFTAEEDFDRTLDEQLERLQTDHIDFYLLHTLSLKYWNDIVLRFHLLDKLAKAKQDGKVRFVGFSFHDEAAAFHTIVDGFDGWDFCQLQLNYIDIENQAGLAGLTYAAAKGLDVIIMEPLLGGKLAAPPVQVAKALDSGKTPVAWALDFLWNRPEVGTVLSGMSTMQQVDDNIAYAGSAQVGMLAGADLEMLAHARTIFNTMALVPCTKCAYCMPCPFGLDILKIYEAYNMTVYAPAKDAVARYGEADGKAKACTRCGACENACPQAIAGGELMPHIAELFAELQAK